ncbi:MAG: hypothetical protein Q7R67_00575 [bacterium]|nr:hypothetical protein [bacterium]
MIGCIVFKDSTWRCNMKWNLKKRYATWQKDREDRKIRKTKDHLHKVAEALYDQDMARLRAEAERSRATTTPIANTTPPPIPGPAPVTTAATATTAAPAAPTAPPQPPAWVTATEALEPGEGSGSEVPSLLRNFILGVAAAIILVFVLQNMFEGVSGWQLAFLVVMTLAFGYLVFKAFTSRKRGLWIAGAAAVLLVAIIGTSYWPENDRVEMPTHVTNTPGTVPIVTPAVMQVATIQPATPSAKIFQLVAKAGVPASVSVPRGWRWDMTPKVFPVGLTTDNGHLDAEGYRIQVFEVVPPVTEVSFAVILTYCTTPQMCAW